MVREQLDHLLDEDWGDDEWALLDRAVCEVLYGAGLRVSELCDLDLRSVDFRQGLLRVMGKGRKERLVPLHRKGLDALREWIKDARDDVMVNDSPPEALFFNRRGNRLGVRDVRRILDNRVARGHVHPHALRHTYATHLLEGEFRYVPVVSCGRLRVHYRVLVTERKETSVALVTLQELLDSGVHFGHQTRRWNPKMRRFILGERNGIYLIDLRKTLAGIEQSYAYVRDLVAEGGIILFVGTKKQTQGPIADYAQACGMPFVNQRWLGGMLTNFSTVAGRVQRMVELRGMQRAGDFDSMPKREALRHSRELEKLDRNLSGISNLDRVPDAIFVIDTKKEHIAVTEARKLGLPVVAVVDTNCDPDVIDYVIPGNDDAIRSGALLCRLIADAVSEGRFIRANRPVITKNASAVTPTPTPTPSATPTPSPTPSPVPETFVAPEVPASVAPIVEPEPVAWVSAASESAAL